jgi:hypothetical protein
MSLEARVTVRCDTAPSGKEVPYQMNHAASILYLKDRGSVSKTYLANYMLSHPKRQQSAKNIFSSVSEVPFIDTKKTITYS